MKVRRLLQGTTAPNDFVPHSLTRWPGTPVAPPVFFDPKLYSNANLKSYGFWATSIHLTVPRADNREFLRRKLQQSVRIGQMGGQTQDMRAVPAVFVPTSPANSYSGMVRPG